MRLEQVQNPNSSRTAGCVTNDSNLSLVPYGTDLTFLKGLVERTSGRSDLCTLALEARSPALQVEATRGIPKPHPRTGLRVRDLKTLHVHPYARCRLVMVVADYGGCCTESLPPGPRCEPGALSTVSTDAAAGGASHCITEPWDLEGS